MNNRLKYFLFPIILAGACIGVYLNSIHNEFLLDDYYVITHNEFIRDIHNLPLLFTKDYFTLAQEMSYRPVPTAVLMVLYKFFGYEVEAYHMSNLFWHTVFAVTVCMRYLQILLWPMKLSYDWGFAKV